MPLVLSHLSAGENSPSKSVPAGVRHLIFLARRARSTSRWLSASTARKSARIPSSMICRVMLTMWPWRMRFLFTTSLICMRDRNSPRCVCAQKTLTCDCARSSRITAGISVRGRSASSSKIKSECGAPISSTSHWSAAAISRVASSVMIVIRSSGFSRRQSRIALRAPG